MTRPMTIAAAGAAGLAGAGLATLVAAHRWRHDYRLREHRVPLLPPGAAPIRVLHLSDLHLLHDDTTRQEWVRSLAALQPDLVVDTGDNHADAEAWRAVVDCLGPLLDRPGAFVWGSNDYFAPSLSNPARYLVRSSARAPEDDPEPDLPWERLGEAFTDRGWIDLNHHRARLRVNDVEIELRGTDDAHHGRDDYARVAGPPDADARLAIGVTHAPYRRVLDGFAGDGLDLILAGHTHGGQVCLPGERAIITNCDLDRRRVKGLHQHTRGAHTAVLHVSAGLGTSPFAPYRLFCPPEATLLTLEPRDAPAAGPGARYRDRKPRARVLALGGRAA